MKKSYTHSNLISLSNVPARVWKKLRFTPKLSNTPAPRFSHLHFKSSSYRTGCSLSSQMITSISNKPNYSMIGSPAARVKGQGCLYVSLASLLLTNSSTLNLYYFTRAYSLTLCLRVFKPNSINHGVKPTRSAGLRFPCSANSRPLSHSPLRHL